MGKIAGLILFGAALAATGNLTAQSIAITPSGIPQVVVGGTVQFSAQVTGSSSNAVAWYSGGVKGGNSTAGTISSAGLYQAPTKLPGQNPVQITAISSVNSKISATTYVYLLGLGPAITAVSPNPISTGTITVTVQGSTFQTGAMVYITYGSNSLIQMSTTAVTPTTVTATGYLGPAATATFCVKNPGTGYSNSIVVPVGSSTPPPPKYTLTVVNGTGGGSYTAGTVVTITANAAPSGQSFTGWTGAAVANAGASSTSLTMPAANTTVTANSELLTYPHRNLSGSITGDNRRLRHPLSLIPRLNAWKPTAAWFRPQSALLPVQKADRFRSAPSARAGIGNCCP